YPALGLNPTCFDGNRIAGNAFFKNFKTSTLHPTTQLIAGKPVELRRNLRRPLDESTQQTFAQNKCSHDADSIWLQNARKITQRLVNVRHQMQTCRTMQTIVRTTLDRNPRSITAQQK